jgi:hypothetical protein
MVKKTKTPFFNIIFGSKTLIWNNNIPLKKKKPQHSFPEMRNNIRAAYGQHIN